MNYNNIITGLRVQTQIPLDYKGFVQSEAALVNLGTGNNLAYTYYKGLIFYCKNEGTRYEWKEVPTGQENTGLRSTDFIYPADFVVDGVNYSNKRYNFFTTVAPISTLNEVLSAGNTSSNPIVLTGFVEGQPSSATFSGNGIVLAAPSNGISLTITESQIKAVGPGATTTIKFQIPTGSFLELYTPNKPTGGYTLATTNDYNLQAVLNNGNWAIDKELSLSLNTGVGSTLRAYELAFNHPGADLSLKYQSNGIFAFNGVNGTGEYTGLQLPVNTSNNVTFTTPLKPTGSYILATLEDISTGLTPPFQKIDEGNGPGYIIRGRNVSFYGNVGEDAIDLSYSDSASTVYGATGSSAFAAGIQVIASNYLSTSFGYLVDNGGNGSFNTGYNLKDRGYTNFLTGIGHDVTSMNVTVVGQAASVVTEQISDFNATPTKALFIVGNGTITNEDPDYTVLTRSNALVVRLNGSVEAPSLTKSLITADTTGKILVTKEYLNLQKIITYPADFTGTNYTITSADMGYSIIIVNGATAVTVTVPTTLVAKMQVGFIQDGTGDVTITPSGTTLRNAISGYKIKGQYDQVFLEQGSTTSVYYLLGNTKV